MERSAMTSFIPYLEAKQRSEREKRNAPQSSGGTALSVLFALATGPQGAMALTDLQQTSGMTFFEFSECLKRLVATGYLSVAGEPGHETASITKLGAEVAALARPV